MSRKMEAISVRTTRLNHLILGHTEATSKTTKCVSDGLYREALLDALCLLYSECDKEFLKKKDKSCFEFVNKYREVIRETNNLRVNIDDFSIKSFIGKGYFGEVHLATEKSTNDIYAIKKIRKSTSLMNSQIREERDIMAIANSDWITSLQYAFQDYDHLYLVMEYLPGGDLLSLMIRNGAFDEDLARFYLAELTLAINALHQMGFVHRDIKPENILLDRFGHLKLADFGNAAQLNKDGNVISLSPVGTPDYIAPELLQTLSTLKIQKSIHDVSCDYWSMGIIGYELISETTPFQEDNVHETYSQILAHCEDKEIKSLEYPTGIEPSTDFRQLIDGLITKSNKRLTYQEIVRQPYFTSINFSNLRQTVPPIIPTLSGDDDTSNFEDVEKKARRSTFSKQRVALIGKGNDFSGQNLPYLGYSFVHQQDPVVGGSSSDEQAIKYNGKIRTLQKSIDEQIAEIKTLQQSLLSAQRKQAQAEALEKMLNEAKEELNNMKEKLKEKTIELAGCKTDVKTLKGALKIEEEMRVKSDANICEVLNSTYQKWEKSRKAAEQGYEKQIAEKKTEISSITQNLLMREKELAAKVDECNHLQETVANYKDLLKSSKDQNSSDRHEFEQNRSQVLTSFESKIAELKGKLKQERDEKIQMNDELAEIKKIMNRKTDECRRVSHSQQSSEKNLEDIKSRLTKQIEENKLVREQKVQLERKISDIEKQFDEQIIELKKFKEQANRYSTSEIDQFKSAHGSFESLSSVVEEQLRNDLLVAKENETLQRKRADRLEEAVTRLEDAISKLGQSKPATSDLLERKNEKLEDQLTAVREQAIVERQQSRSAHLSLWKLEKQVEELQQEKKSYNRRLELSDDKMKRLRDEKDEIERRVKDHVNTIRLRDETIQTLHDDIQNLRDNLKHEHQLWETAEQERMKEKSEIIEHVSTIQKLEEQLVDWKHKMNTTQRRNDELVFENKRLQKDMSTDAEKLNQTIDTLNELQQEHGSLQFNYQMLKDACSTMESQLNELEAMYGSQVKHSKTLCEKSDELWRKIRSKDDELAKLKQDFNTERSERIASETKSAHLYNELQEKKEEVDKIQQQMIGIQENLVGKTSDLFETQERVEILSSELSNLQRANQNFDRELHILKEENTRILTSLFLAKEENNKLAMICKDYKNEIDEMRKEIEQLNGTLSEQKNYYLQRDIKSEATLVQYKKLIEYLQQRVEELSHKKKKTLADVLFGSSTTGRKENIPPKSIEETATFRRIQEDLRRERARCSQLKEELLKAQTDLRFEISKTVSNDVESHDEVDVKPAEEVPKYATDLKINPPKTESSTSNRQIQLKRRSYQTHRFEMTLESVSAEQMTCVVCSKPIMLGNTHWKCKECKRCVHRKCRSGVVTSCEGSDHCPEILAKCSNDDLSTGTDSSSSNDGVTSAVANLAISKDYFGEIVYRKSNLNSIDDGLMDDIKIQFAYQIMEQIILFGCQSGLYSYRVDSQTLVRIDGVDSIEFIAADTFLSKCIMIGSQGHYLYQCDMRHLQNKAQASKCLHPSIEPTVIDIPFANRGTNESWHYAKLYSATNDLTDAYCIAATTSRIVILHYDTKYGRFKPVRALDTAKPVTSILFTAHTAIVSSDKFFEIDLNTFIAEEFLDMSDTTIVQSRNRHPMAAISVSNRELLMCFKEFGIFVDEYGLRSRPEDLQWLYVPFRFMYREPLLYITHEESIQVLRITKSYSKHVNALEMRSFIQLDRPMLIGEWDRIGVYMLTHDRDEEVVSQLDGVRALKNYNSTSLETLSSLSTYSGCLAASTDTLSTMGNNGL